VKRHCTRITLLLCAVAAAAVGAGATRGPAEAEGKRSETIVVKLKPVDGSGVSGTATLQHVGDRTRVAIALGKHPPGKLPAHLHFGSCRIPNNSNLAAGLNDVVKGRSVTTLDLPTWAEIRKAKLSVHVHVPSFWVIACGDLPPPRGK
jgi:hypothetical protein